MPAISSKQLNLSLNNLPAPGRWEEIFGWSGPLELEIGFGWDPFLIRRAARCPGTGFIGLEYDRKRVEIFCRRAAAEGLANLRAVCGDAWYCLPRLFVENQIQRTFILFPDPWPKKRQQKNRLLDPEFLRLLFHFMVTGGELTAGTDSPEYRDFIQQSLLEVAGLENLNGPLPWVDHIPDLPATRFEQLFRRQGKEIFFFRYAKQEVFARFHRSHLECVLSRLPRKVDDMPHCILQGPLDLSNFQDNFQPASWRDGQTLYRITEIWVPSRRTGVLMESVIVHEGQDRLFFTELTCKDKGLVLRISPMREVERDELLFRFMTGLVNRLLASFPGLEILRHNLGRFLPAP